MTRPAWPLDCPSCGAKIRLVVDAQADKAPAVLPAPASGPTPGVHVAPPYEEKAEDRAAREAEHERLFRGATAHVQSVCLNLIDLRFADRRRELNERMRRPADTPLTYPDKVRADCRAEVLAEQVKAGWLKPRTAPKNEPSPALPVHDRDEEDETT